MNARTVADGWDDACAASKRDALTTMDLRDAEMPRLITAAFATDRHGNVDVDPSPDPSRAQSSRMSLNLGYDDK
ncbi:hypothetical protein ALC60_06207 [Trachymyrmex zeteki]|uniref:Uncharacterized protein n=1 Tax=Mycetomoellerius zeteki TaxID=64791 RepID=A0A151X359_9HYME|nr:hypothetical protein ALC60_06207 [Trachymyrmex zeteki]